MHPADTKIVLCFHVCLLFCSLSCQYLKVDHIMCSVEPTSIMDTTVSLQAKLLSSWQAVHIATIVLEMAQVIISQN